MIWDTHAHLNDRQFDVDRDEVIERARQGGVTTIINIGDSEATSRQAVSLAAKYPFIYASVGVHPHEAKNCNEETWTNLSRLAQNPKVVAWGEIGLDYYRNLSPRDVQRQVFIRQLELADEMGLPVVIHDRDAHGDILQILKKHPPQAGGVFHSFSGSWEMAKELLSLGFYLSFSGPLTFKNNRKTVEVATNIPEDRFVVETDCPYLTPEPYRGKRNEPLYVNQVINKIAELKGISTEKAALLAVENSRRLFRITK
ncbi:MAG: TatD family hydrolase [Peptococcaceae bacterium]|nr:TatD family hydrolase [Peptococcaceae bacterium]